MIGTIFKNFLQRAPAKNVSHVKTALAIRSAKQLFGIPIEVATVDILRLALLNFFRVEKIYGQNFIGFRPPGV